MRWILLPLLLFCGAVWAQFEDDFAGHPGGGEKGFSGDASVVASEDTFVYLWRTDDDSTTNATHGKWPVSKKRIITDTDGADMAYEHIADKVAADSSGASVWGGSQTNRFQLHSIVSPGTLPSDSKRYGVVWFNLDQLKNDYPGGVTVTEAWLCFETHSVCNSLEFAGDVGFHCVLDTLASDMGWLDGPTYVSGYAEAFRYRNSSWLKMNHTANEDWAPAMDDRVASYGWGIRSPGLSSIDQGDDVAFDVKKLVQMYVDGFAANNAGFWIFAQTGADGIYQLAVGPHAATVAQPFLMVRFVPKSHGQPWGGYPMMLAFTTDDQHVDNDTFRTVFDEFGWKYTIMVREDNVGLSANYYDEADIIAAQADGYEIGGHSLNHFATWGMQKYQGQDSIATEASRSILADSIGINASTVKVFAYPGHKFNDHVQAVLDSLGYIAARDGAYGVDPAADAPGGSGGDASAHLSWDNNSNIFAIARTDSIGAFVGSDKADAKVKLYKVIDELWRDGQSLLCLYTHDTRYSDTYEAGINSNQLRWLLELIQEHGGFKVGTLGQAATIYRNGHYTSNNIDWSITPPEPSDETAPTAEQPAFAKLIGDSTDSKYHIHVASDADESAVGWWTYAETGQSFMYADSTEGHGYMADSADATPLATSISDTFRLPTSDWGNKRVTWKYQLRDGVSPPNVSSAIDSTSDADLSLWLSRFEDTTAPTAQNPIFVKLIGDSTDSKYHLHVAADADEDAVLWATYAEAGQSFMYADSTEGHGYMADSADATPLATSISDTFRLPTADWGDKRVTFKLQLRDGWHDPNVATAIDSTDDADLSIWLARASAGASGPQYRVLTVESDSVGGAANMLNFPLCYTDSLDSYKTTGNGGMVADAEGDDIFFTKVNGDTLDYEIEYWSGTTGKIVAWVRLDTLYYNSDTYLRIHYGDTSPTTSRADSAGLWTDYQFVCHMQESDDNKLYDATGNEGAIDTYGGNMPTEDFHSWLGNRQDFDGTGDYLEVTGTVYDFSSNIDYTLTFWFEVDALGSGEYWNWMVGSRETSGDGWNASVLDNAAGGDEGYVRHSHRGGSTENVQSAFAPSLDTIYMWGAVFDGTGQQDIWFYLNGFETATDATFTDPASGDDDLCMGIDPVNHSDDPFNGFLDEVRVYMGLRSAEWISAEHANIRYQDAFLSVGEETAK